LPRGQDTMPGVRLSQRPGSADGGGLAGWPPPRQVKYPCRSADLSLTANGTTPTRNRTHGANEPKRMAHAVLRVA
jgi:hypothetical protein